MNPFSVWPAILSILCIVHSLAAPTNVTSPDQKFLVPAPHKAVASSPHWVVYGDSWDGSTGPPGASGLQGYNVFNMAFLLLAGAWDKAYEWTSLTDAERASIKSQYAAACIKLVVSVFGATDIPTTSKADPITTANTMAAWVKKYDVDGIDVDYEDFAAFNAGDGSAENWLISFTKQLRTQLPQGQYILTHAPVAPWFSPVKFGSGGGYLKIHEKVGSLIDWYNVQFYNQGASEYTTCDNLLFTSSSAWPETALFEIALNGVPLDKLVIGKPASASDASNGFVPTGMLASCLKQAKAEGWNGGAMVWQYSHAPSSWIKAVRASSWTVL